MVPTASLPLRGSVSVSNFTFNGIDLNLEWESKFNREIDATRDKLALANVLADDVRLEVRCWHVVRRPLVN